MVAPSFALPVPAPDPWGATGAQFVGCDAVGGAVCAGGVAGEAGACACAATAGINRHEASMRVFIRMEMKTGNAGGGSGALRLG